MFIIVYSCFLTYFTNGYSVLLCLPLFIRVYPCFLIFYCLILLIRVDLLPLCSWMFTDICSCLPKLNTCLPMFTLFTRVYPCLLVFTYVYKCLLSLPMLTIAYSCMFTYVYPCLLVFTYFNTSLHIHVYHCLLVFTYVYSALTMFNFFRVDLCLQ